MMMHDMTLTLPAHLTDALRRLARERGDEFDALVRGMLDREVMRLRSAQASQRMRRERLARLHGLLTPVIEAARDWSFLQAHLALFGYELRPEGASIALYDRATGEWLCRGADLGIAYPLLVRRFGGPLAPPSITANVDDAPDPDSLHPVA